MITIGKLEKIGGVDSYVATPTGDYPKNKAILFLTDLFGPQIINAQVRSFKFYKFGDRNNSLSNANHPFSSSRMTSLPMASKLMGSHLLRSNDANFHLMFLITSMVILSL